MITYKLLASSDHHGNWESFEAQFEYAKKHKLPFVINGDIIGDYNFDELAESLDLKYPFQITQEQLLENLDDEEQKALKLYQQVKQIGEGAIISQLHESLHQKAKDSITKSIQKIESEEFQSKLGKIQDNLHIQAEEVITEHRLKLQALYKIITRTHAKKFAALIEKYHVQTYFVPGNHEPIHFAKVTQEYMKNPNLLVDLSKTKGITDVNGIKIAGIPNVAALMGFLSNIYSEDELNQLFSHQQGIQRPILYQNVSKETVESQKDKLDQDPDWQRLQPIKEIDVFFSHGQVGIGAWRDEKKCPETPTLLVAAMLSHLAQVTVDAHLHSSHEMTNQLDKPMIRAVGNKAYVISKDHNKITYEKIEFDTPYNARGGIKLSQLDKAELIVSDLIWK